MQCSTCGSSLAADARFCPQCGTPTFSNYANYANSGASLDKPTALAAPFKTPSQIPSREHGSTPYGVPVQNPYEPLNPYEIPPPPPPSRRPKFGLLIGLVVLVLVLASVGAFAFLSQGVKKTSQGNTSTPTAPPNACGGAFSDEFKGNLHPGWNWIDLGGDATYTVTAQGLRISTPANANGNNDINPLSNDNAPHLLQPISGNFTVETQVQFNPAYQFQSAGILIWQDGHNFLRFERDYWDKTQNGSGILFQKAENGDFLNIGGPFTTAAVVDLRVERNGDHFTSSWREPGKDWQIDSETDLHFYASTMVGVDLLNVYNTPPTTAYFNYFRVSCT